MFVRRVFVFLLLLLLALPFSAFAQSEGAYYTIEYQSPSGDGEMLTAFEVLDFDVITDAAGNVWFLWHPQVPQPEETVPESVQIYYWAPNGVGADQCAVLDPATGENRHQLSGTERAPKMLLIQTPYGQETRQFILSTLSPEDIGLSSVDFTGGGASGLNEPGFNEPGFNEPGFNEPDINGSQAQPEEGLQNWESGDSSEENFNPFEGNELETSFENESYENEPYNEPYNEPNQNQNAAGQQVLQGVNTSGTIITPESSLGVLTNDGAVLYGQPLQQAVTTLPKDTVIEIVGQAEQIDGTLWYPVTVLNNVDLNGYLSESAFLRMTLEQDEAFRLSYGTPQPHPSNETNYVTITSGTVLRHSPAGMPIDGAVGANIDAEYVSGASIPNGYDSYNRLWLYVRLSDGREGYIPSDSVSFWTADDDRLKPDPEMPTLPSNYARSAMEGNILRDASTLQEFDTVKAGEIGKYLGQYTTIDKEIWLLMEFSDGTVGYICYNRVVMLSEADAAKHELDQKPVPDTPTLESKYAQIKQNLTPILDASTKTQFSTLDAGQIGEFLFNDPNYKYVDSAKELWLLMQVGTKKGYVQYSSAALQVFTAQQAADHENQNQPAQTLSPVESAYARANASNTQVVQINTATNAKDPVKLLNKDDVVLYLPHRSGATYTDPTDKKLWLLVEYGTSQTGYVKADTVTFLTLAEEKTHKDKINATPTPSPSPTPTQVVITASPRPVAPQVSGLMKTNTSAVLYYWNYIGSLPKAALNAGTVVYVQEQTYDHYDGTTLWSFVQYETASGLVNGYIPSSALSTMTMQEQQAYFVGRQTATPSPAPTYAPSNFSGYLLITKNQVNFRSGPSTTSSMTQRLQYGTIVRALGTESMNDGYTWYYCESSGQLGYVRGDNIRELTVQEYLNIVTMPSYTQGTNVITPTATAKPQTGIDYSNWATQKTNANATITFQTIPPVPVTMPANASASPSASIDPEASPDSTEAGDFLSTLETATPDPSASALETIEPEFPTEETSGSSTGVILAGVILALLGGGGLYGYSLYNKARRKQAQEQVKRLAADARQKAQQAEKELGTPAVRRPVPQGAAGAAAAGAAAAGAQAKKPGQPSPGQQKPVQPGQQRPGQQPLGQQKPGQAATGAPGVNPYARPQPRTQEVASTMPRSQVDGKPVDTTAPIAAPTTATTASTTAREAREDGYTTTQPNLYARPVTEKSRMPIAPAPTPAPTASEAEAIAPRRRRRRAETADEQGPADAPASDKAPERGGTDEDKE